MGISRRADRAIAIALFLLLMSFAIAACGGGSAGGAPQGPAQAPAGNGGELLGGGAGLGEGEGDREAPAQPAPSAGNGQPELGAVDDAQIIRTGSMVLEVGDVPHAVREARDAILGMRGYVGASQTSSIDDQPYAQITYRIPVDRWEDALDALRGVNGDT